MSRTFRKTYPPYRDFDSPRDGRKFYKAGSVAKDLTKAKRRAQERDAMRHVLEGEDEILPQFKRTNDFDFGG